MDNDDGVAAVQCLYQHLPKVKEEHSSCVLWKNAGLNSLEP